MGWGAMFGRGRFVTGRVSRADGRDVHPDFGVDAAWASSNQVVIS